MKEYYTPEEKKKFDDLRKEFQGTTFLVSALSLGNVVAVAALWRKFLNLKTWQKTGVCIGTFLVSHKSGMLVSERKSLEYHNEMIEKYKKHVYEINFDDMSAFFKKK